MGKKRGVTRRHEVRLTRYDAPLGAVEQTIHKSTSCVILFGVNKPNINQNWRCWMQLSYTNVERFIKPVFSHLGVHQFLNLTLIVYGSIHSRSLECAEIARHVPTETNHHHTKKRIHRFLDNKGVDLSVLMKCWCRFVVMMLFYRFRTFLPVIVDITWVNGEKYLVAAIPFLFRSIPIAFRRFIDEEIRQRTPSSCGYETH